MDNMFNAMGLVLMTCLTVTAVLVVGMMLFKGYQCYLGVVGVC